MPGGIKTEDGSADQKEGGGKRPRRSTRPAKYVYNDDDENDSDASAAGEGGVFDDAVEEHVERKPPKRQKVQKRTYQVKPKKKGTGKFKCRKCKKVFKSEGGLQYHKAKNVCVERAKRHDKPETPKKQPKRRIIETAEDGKCPNCKRVFKSNEGLRYHVGK